MNDYASTYVLESEEHLRGVVKDLLTALAEIEDEPDLEADGYETPEYVSHIRAIAHDAIRRVCCASSIAVPAIVPESNQPSNGDD